jgi:hypothetical protein
VARPPSQFYRLQKLVRRNKVLFGSGAAVTLALAAGLGVALALLVRERELRRRAVAAEQEQARLRAVAERGLATEAELRRQSEWRENIRQAAVLISHKAYAEADQLIAQLPAEPSTMEGAEVLRTLGEWNAVQERWPEAKTRFHALQRASRFDKPMDASLDWTRTAVAIIESNDQDEYDRFCQDAIATFGSAEDPIVAERTVRNCLLVPASQSLINSLGPLAQCVKKSLERTDFSASITGWQIPWRCQILALWEYRAGSPAEAVVWCRRCLASEDRPPVRAASARIILAMSLQRLGKTEEAHTQLKQGRAVIESRFENSLAVGDGNVGVWFDWVMSRLWLREAEAVLGDRPDISD